MPIESGGADRVLVVPEDSGSHTVNMVDKHERSPWDSSLVLPVWMLRYSLMAGIEVELSMMLVKKVFVGWAQQNNIWSDLGMERF